MKGGVRVHRVREPQAGRKICEKLMLKTCALTWQNSLRLGAQKGRKGIQRWRGCAALDLTQIICGIIERMRRLCRRQWGATGGCPSDSDVRH